MRGKINTPYKIFIVSLLCVLAVGGVFIMSLFTMVKAEEPVKNGTPTDVSNYTPISSVSQENITSSERESSSSSSSLSSPLYTVKEYEGVIGIFNYGEAEPFDTEKTKVQNLPEKDRELIEKGVDFQSYGELIAFIEDYE